MKKAAALALVLAALAAGGTYYLSSPRPCEAPLKYSFGTFDPRFGITQTEFAKVADEAAAIWEQSAGRDLFVYDPAAQFKINLVYDERQQRTDEYNQIKAVLDKSEGKFKTVEEEYQAVLKEYDAKRAAYEKATAAFERDLKTYNADVAFWNKRGGAPDAKYQELQSRKAALDRRADALEGDRRELNALGKRVNILAEQGNSLADSYNDVVATYNQKFGTSTEFDQGIFRGDAIDIYEFKGMPDLRMVMAHEFGHALGIDHVENPKSIMYYFMGEQNLNKLSPTPEDASALARSCRLR